MDSYACVVLNPGNTFTMPLTQLRRVLGVRAIWVVVLMMAGQFVACAELLWSDPDPRVIHSTPQGFDILAGATKRDDTASDALYFKFHVDPLSDAATEEYYAVFQLFESDAPRLAVGNAPEAWGYSAYYTAETGPSNAVAGEFNLMSAQPEAAGLGVFKPYEVVRHNQERTIVFKVQYIPNADDLVTVWLSPKLTGSVSEESQPAKLTTKFKANASFNQIRLRHDGKGNGWIFSDMAIATSFSDFVVVRFWQQWWFFLLVAVTVLAVVVATVRLTERRKYQMRLQKAEQERALERERGRIAQDLHDDLGSSLARISLLSGLAREDRADPQQVLTHLNKIAQAADETVRALEEIVWAVRPGSDSLQSLVEYIAHFSNELFEGNGTRCRLDLPHDLPQLSLPPELRHNIFLVVKEALTNVIKHAQAREVHVQAKATADTLEFVVQDDGHGFEPGRSSHESQRNGLSNMQRRAATMGGQLTVQSTKTGTLVRLVVPIAATDQKQNERSG